MDSADIFAWVFAILIIVVIVLVTKSKNEAQKAANQRMTYDKNEYTLTLKARNSENASFIRIENRKFYSNEYHPSEIVYTGATVGGVHTGGFHEVGNYYSTNASSTNKYQLVYRYASKDDYCPIDKIKLDPSLISQARQNPTIQKFLKKRWNDSSFA